jgi:hypothetical protein
VGRDQYPFEVHGIDTILEEGINVEDLEVRDLLLFILMELRTINVHLASMTDEEVEGKEMSVEVIQ